MKVMRKLWPALLAFAAMGMAASIPAAAQQQQQQQQQQKRPNIVMLMTDDTGWNDFGAYTGGGAALGHPRPDREGRCGVL